MTLLLSVVIFAQPVVTITGISPSTGTKLAPVTVTVDFTYNQVGTVTVSLDGTVVNTQNPTGPGYSGAVVSITTAGTHTLKVSETYYNGTGSVSQSYDAGSLVRYYYIKDHLGTIRETIDKSDNVVAAQDYYSYGEYIRSYNQGLSNDRYKFTGKERDNETNLDYFGARYYESSSGRWLSADPMEDKYPGWSSYNYVFDNPLIILDPEGNDSLYFVDQLKQPEDNYKTANYTASVYVIINGKMNGPYSGSTFPDSKEGESVSNYNTIKEGEYDFNNKHGHIGPRSGAQKGLNIVKNKDLSDEKNRTGIPGTDPFGNDKPMSDVDIHKGYYSRRYSEGCLTISPKDWPKFIKLFDWSGKNGYTGESEGKVFIYRLP